MAPEQQYNSPSSREKERERLRDGRREGSSAPVTNSPKDRVGQYILGSEIGKGSFATVYKGYIHKTREPVAIKAVSRGKLTPKLLENLEGEINIMKACIHRNVVALRECIKNENFIYLIMDFCSGGDLSIYIRKRGRLASLEYPLPDPTGQTQGQMVFWPHPQEGGLDDFVVRNFLGQLAEALKFLRDKNLIHRDIKPQNLLLQPPTEAEYASGHPLGIPMLKVADFGFARSLPAAALAETLCGSPLYMAPEILRYEKYDAKADLWSVGAVLFEMAVGKPPFKATNHVELLKKIERNDDKIRFPDEQPSSRDEMEDYSDLRNAPPVANDIKELIRKLLKKKPVMRMGFNEFFDCSVWAGCMKQPRKAHHPAYSDGDFAKEASRRPSTLSTHMGQQPPIEGQIPRSSAAQTRAPSVSAMTSRPVDARHQTPGLTPLSRERSTDAGSNAIPSQKALPRDIKTETSRAVGSERDRPSQPGISAVDKPINEVGREDRQVEREPRFSNQRKSPDSRATTSHNGRENRRMSPLASESGPSPIATEEGDVERKIQDSDEYVVVEKRNVEVNVLADELDAATRRPDMLARRRSSRLSTFTRPISALAAGATAAANAITHSTGGSPVSYSPPFTMSSTPPFALPPGAQHHRAPSFHSVSSSPNLHARSRPMLVPHPVSSYGCGLTYHQTAQDAQARYSESSSPGAHGLTRVLTSAGVRFFGSPVNVLGNLSRRPWNRAHNSLALREQEPQEEALVQKLDDLAQKASVVFEFADTKLALCTPSATRPSASLGTSGISPSSHITSAAARRRSSATSSASTELSSAKLDTLCAEALVLYVKALNFLQFGMDQARQYWESRVVSADGSTTSPEFNETVQWFRGRFNECFEKAEWARSRCPEDIPSTAAFAEKMLYNKAVELSRNSAKLELEGEELAVAEHGYETALCLLLAFCDNILHDNQPMPDPERVAAEKVIVSVRIRLDSLRRKIALDNSSAVTLTGTNR
ncbi:hypothetical protein NliqN6_3187 [Naganishia liquefaciens]|uniref:non-specific serine/threonine protein kinase n=1 Tax=Naganishia liquefaciens TaxID=104408 RepID=A0A8H3YEP0_9TREE|nr:hypothetical protein NliqN6_3187 [Naganishia liquefaciens]